MFKDEQSRVNFVDFYSDKNSLTPREREIVLALSRNVTATKEISAFLGISTNTVRNHFENIYKKTGRDNKIELAIDLFSSALDSLKSFATFAETPKVLIVDDDVDFANFLKTDLSQRGFDVESVNSPELALSKIKYGNYDHILSDMRMPEMNGREMLTELHKIMDKVPHIIFMSGFTDYPLSDLMNEGAVDFVNKPFLIDEVFYHIRNYFIKDVERRNKLMTSDVKITRKIKAGIIFEEISVGKGGCFISANQMPNCDQLHVGKSYEFKIKSEDANLNYQMQGEVVWKREKESDEAGVGVRFISITPEMNDLINNHIFSNNISSFIPLT